ncbi:hypothetical protein APSETT445_005899 [Aspergillus pseudonomiae]
MIILGGAQLLRVAQRDRSDSQVTSPKLHSKIVTASFLQMSSIALPIYAALKVGGFLVAFVLALAIASGVPTLARGYDSQDSKARLSQKKLTIGVIATVVVLSFLAMNTSWDAEPFLGYVSLLVSVFVIRPPFLAFTLDPAYEAAVPQEKLSSLESSGVSPSDPMLTALLGLLLAVGTTVAGGLYFHLSGSLGLLSDSIHMFFDCLALVVGLCAAVMSKWPPSARFPYGYGKVDTLSGFANGIFLMIISIEIIYEAVERLSSGSQMHRIGELLVVSAAGLAVNLVGIMAFDHAHHGHDHGHDHSHDNENMHGIFLHILADTLGSVAVVISTILVHYSGWSGYDPIASCMIAILIFASAVPLVSSTAKKLLLTLPADVEYNVRETLAGVSTLRGVVGYTVPKFWLDDTGKSDHDHDHGCGHGHSHHDHDHDHSHNHNHSHSHGHGHGHSHSPNHSHSHSHSHNHDHDHAHEKSNPNVLGVIHVIASRGSDLEDVRQRTVDFLREKGMDILVQVEREGDGRCWCGGGGNKSS